MRNHSYLKDVLYDSNRFPTNTNEAHTRSARVASLVRHIQDRSASLYSHTLGVLRDNRPRRAVHYAGLLRRGKANLCAVAVVASLGHGLLYRDRAAGVC